MRMYAGCGCGCGCPILSSPRILVVPQGIMQHTRPCWGLWWHMHFWHMCFCLARWWKIRWWRRFLRMCGGGVCPILSSPHILVVPQGVMQHIQLRFHNPLPQHSYLGCLALLLYQYRSRESEGDDKKGKKDLRDC